MGSSRGTAARVLSFLIAVQTQGAQKALLSLNQNLAALAGQPIETIFSGLADYICPPGGNVDEGIARAAFTETIVDLAQAGITDLNALNADQVQTVLELFMTHAIESRLCNDIGAQIISFPSDLAAATQVEAQLHDFIARAVSDALSQQQAAVAGAQLGSELQVVDRVYEESFRLLKQLGDVEADT